MNFFFIKDKGQERSKSNYHENKQNLSKILIILLLIGLMVTSFAVARDITPASAQEPPELPVITSFTATAISSSQANLSWSASGEGIDGYLLWNWETNSYIYSGMATSFSHTGLNASTLYQYVVWAHNNAGWSSQADTSATTTSIVKADVFVDPPTKTVNRGETFNIGILIDPHGISISGAQADIAFDPAVLKVNSITEGNLFKQNGASTYFFISKGIDNSLGTAGSVVCVILGPHSVSTEGTFFVINATAIGSGTSRIDLSNVKIADPDAQAVPLNTTNGNVTVLLDSTAPTSSITTPTNGSAIYASTYTIQGTADDGTGSGVQKVEVSTDGGSTWNLATGTNSWSYVWTIPGVGTYTVKSRATDNAGNVETSGAGITVTVVQRQPTSVTINGRKILVNGNSFTIKGVGYSPVPIGNDPETTPPYGDYFTSDNNNIYDRDFPLLRDMGANTIRLWGWNNTADHLDFLDKAYNGGIDPIYVIAGFWINAGLDIDPDSPTNIREQLKAEFRETVAIHKNHPAILMWTIGDELNADWMYGGNLNDLFSLINEMTEEAHTEEGTNYHPVTTPLLDSNLINTIATYDASTPSLNIWGANIYRGNTFGTLFNDYKTVSNKPLVILEYGIDAYDNAHGNEYEKLGTPYQADYAEALWKEIAANSDTCIGSSIMEYSDEWWKGKYSADPNCTDNDPAFHGTCGYATTSHPDGYSNEEWWGIMRTKDNGSSPDIMEPRAVYYRLQSIWLPQYKLTVTKSGTGTGTVTSNPSGIICGSDCSESYNPGTVVTLTATPATGSTFASWSGCTPTPTNPKKCTATVNDNLTVTATFNGKYFISGTIKTSSGTAIAGVIMTLSGAATGTTITDSLGRYRFTGLGNGSYTITPSKTGYTFIPSGRDITVSGANVTGQNFTGATSGGAYSISGKVTTSSGTAIAGVTMTLSGAATGTTATDSLGRYKFTGLINGSYMVTPGKTGYTFTPTNRAVTINGANRTGQNFRGNP